MKSFESELKKYTEKTRLKVSERQEVRERILAFMEYHPLTKSGGDVSMEHAFVSEPFWVMRLNKKVMRYVGGAFIFLMIVVPFVAERAMPGDILYAVKTGINEPFQSQFATSPYEKIEFETRLMERRIAEARVLASKGELTDEVKSHIAETVKAHSSTVQQEIASLREADAESAAIAQIAFSSSLEAQSVVLGATSEDVITLAMDSGTEEVEDPILSAVNEAQSVASREQGSTTPSFDALMARIELQTTRAYELYKSIKASATEEEVKDIDRRFSDVNRIIEESKDKKLSDEDVAAKDLALTLKQVQKLILFMTDIDVRKNVALNDLVPVVLSKGERIEVAREESRVVGEMLREVTNTMVDVHADGVVEKIQHTLAETDVLMLKASTAIDIQDVDTAETSLAQARALALDMQALIAQHAPTAEEGRDIELGEGEPVTDSATSTSTESPSETQ